MMTITEAIETLRANYPDACYEQLREAVDAAIVVLKAQDTAGDTVVSRQAVRDWLLRGEGYVDKDTIIRMQARVIDVPSAGVEPVKRGYLEERRWIPCSDGLPDDIRPVIVTWKNTAPASYYQHIVGKHFTGTACYKNGKWYWYSSITEDMLAEYGRYDPEEFDEAIECIAWMPLPKPYKEEGENNEDQND